MTVGRTAWHPVAHRGRADHRPSSSRIEGRAGRLSLNRPKAIHALDLDMVLAMTAALLEWLHDPAVEAVLIDHAEGRGFCAGGDVVTIAEERRQGTARRRSAFFFKEYRLNHLLFTYPKPTVVFMDGITMGGGVGISLPVQIPDRDRAHPASPCRRPRSACSPTSAAAGICRGCPGGWRSSWR